MSETQVAVQGRALYVASRGHGRPALPLAPGR